MIRTMTSEGEKSSIKMADLRRLVRLNACDKRNTRYALRHSKKKIRITTYINATRARGSRRRGRRRGSSTRRWGRRRWGWRRWRDGIVRLKEAVPIPIIFG